MSRINIRYHKKQFPAVFNSLFAATKKCKSYQWIMTNYEILQMRKYAELDEVVLDICILSQVPYEKVVEYVDRRSIDTGHLAIDIAYYLREKALSGEDMAGIVTS